MSLPACLPDLEGSRSVGEGGVGKVMGKVIAIKDVNVDPLWIYPKGQFIYLFLVKDKINEDIDSKESKRGSLSMGLMEVGTVQIK